MGMLIVVIGQYRQTFRKHIFSSHLFLMLDVLMMRLIADWGDRVLVMAAAAEVPCLLRTRTGFTVAAKE